MKMIYIYLNKEDRCIISKEKIDKLRLVKVYQWEFDSLPESNIRPWKILGTSDSTYKIEVLDYLKDIVDPPQENSQNYIYKKDVDEILDGYTNILNILKQLELIDDRGWNLKWKKFIVYECDVENYLLDTLGEDVLNFCKSFKELEKRKRDILIQLSNLKSRENQLSYLNTIDVDIDIFQFLPPWFKINYQVFREKERVARNSEIVVPEFKEKTGIDSYTGESLIRSHIYEIIKPGDVLSSKDIKDKLSDLYKYLGIQRIPKVNDLDDYFEWNRTYSRHYRILKIKS